MISQIFESLLKAIMIPFGFGFKIVECFSDLVINGALSPFLIIVVSFGGLTLWWIYYAGLCSAIAEQKERNHITAFIKGLFTLRRQLRIVKGLSDYEALEKEKESFIKKNDHKKSVDLTNKMEDAEFLMKLRKIKAKEAIIDKQLEKEAVIYNQLFFEQMRINGGPYQITLKNGKIVEADKLTDIGGDFIIIKTLDVNNEWKKIKFSSSLIKRFIKL